MFIAFEGIEGSGKSTLIEAVAGNLRSAGRDVLTTREPGGTAAGEAIRGLFLGADAQIDAVTEAFLVNAARAQLVAEVVEPALRRGRVVLCDRFGDSTLAYQGYGRGLPLTLLRTLIDAATGGRYPDLTVLADISVATSRARTAARGAAPDRMETAGAAFHQRDRDGYLRLARDNPRMVVVDGEQAPERVAEAALAAIAKLREIPA